MTDRTADDWNRAILAAPAEHLSRLRRTQRENGLEAVPTFTRPVICNGADLEVISRDLALVHSAIDRLVRRWAEGSPTDVVLQPEVAALAREAVARGPVLGFTRYDVVYSAAHRDFKILECQAGDPSALGWGDALARGLGVRSAFTAALTTLIRSRLPGVDKPSLAFVCARESFVRSDHLLLGAACGGSVVDPRDLQRKSDGLYAEGQRIQLCVRDTIDELVLEPWRAGGRVLLDAWRDGLLEVLNPFSAIVADDKSLFEALSTGEADFTTDERAALARRIPWTRVLRPALRSEVLDRRAQLVLKPADGYGGFGIVLGPDSDAQRWSQEIDRALAGPKIFIVQQFVELPEEDFPVFTQDAVRLQRQRLVGSFWWINDAFAGAFHRASPARIVNVHQGGGLVPTHFRSFGQL